MSPARLRQTYFGDSAAELTCLVGACISRGMAPAPADKVGVLAALLAAGAPAHAYSAYPAPAVCAPMQAAALRCFGSLGCSSHPPEVAAEIIALLARHGANADAIATNGQGALYAALQCGGQEHTALGDRRGETPRFVHIRRVLATALLAAGANPNLKSMRPSISRRPLDCLQGPSALPIALALVAAGADTALVPFTKADGTTTTYLHEAGACEGGGAYAPCTLACNGVLAACRLASCSISGSK